MGICVLFMALHIGIMSQANRVYSENSDINLSVNRLAKRAWTSGLVYASWTNGAAWIFMAAGYYIAGPDLPAWIYVVYSILLTVGAAALLIPIASSVRKRKAVLESDQEAYYTDDDEYWKYGWYNNPDDDYIRTNGGSTDKVNIGHFRGKETGKCMMFLYKGYSPILEIRLEDGMTVYINSREEKETEEWYEMAADIG